MPQFVDLQQLPKRDEQAVLLDLTIAQNYFPCAGERIWVSGAATGVEMTFQPTRDHPAHTAGVRDDTIGLHVMKLNADSERRIFGLRQERKAAGYFPATGAGRDLGKIELIGSVA